MLDRVVMDIIRVAGKVGLVAYLVLPISMLPDSLLAFPLSRRIGYPPECVGTMLGESGLDQAPAGREVGIVGRQSPDTVKMIGHDDNRIDVERTRMTNGPKSIAQRTNGFVRRQNGATTIRHEREEEGTARHDGASIVHGGCRVTLR